MLSRRVEARYPVAVTVAPHSPPLEIPSELQYRISVDVYHRMIDAGILGEDDRVELLEGVIVAMPPQRADHSALIARLTRWLVRAAGDEYSVRVQLPLAVSDDSEPEPDLALVRAADESLRAQPAWAALVVEGSRTTLDTDRRIKGALYARAGIPEYWLVDVVSETVEVYAEPDTDASRYRTLVTIGREGSLRAAALPTLAIPVLRLFE